MLNFVAFRISGASICYDVVSNYQELMDLQIQFGISVDVIDYKLHEMGLLNDSRFSAYYYLCPLIFSGHKYLKKQFGCPFKLSDNQTAVS